VAKLGINAVAYLNTAITWTTPTWAALDFISDLAEKSDWDHAEIIIRRSWVKQGAKTVIDVGITCKMLREPGNVLYEQILDALRSRATVDMMFLDADLGTIGAEGIRYIAQVIKGGGTQNPNEALWRDIDFIPFPDGDPTHPPSWADVSTAGAAVFTSITGGADTTLGALGADRIFPAKREPKPATAGAA
jgi:hypothetical protein